MTFLKRPVSGRLPTKLKWLYTLSRQQASILQITATSLTQVEFGSPTTYTQGFLQVKAAGSQSVQFLFTKKKSVSAKKGLSKA